MSAFDHDKAGARGVERQEAVESTTREAYSFVDSLSEEYKGSSSNELLARLGIEVVSLIFDRLNPARDIDEKLEAEIGRTADEYCEALSAKAKSEPEARMMMLQLAKKLIGSGTGPITSDFAMWESQTFRQ